MLTEEKKFKLLLAIFKDDARRFYNENIRNEVAKYAGAVGKLDRHFNDLPQQHRINGYLFGLRPDRFEKDGIKTSDAGQTFV